MEVADGGRLWWQVVMTGGCIGRVSDCGSGGSRRLLRSGNHHVYLFYPCDIYLL